MELNKGILSKKRDLIIKVKNPHKREKEISKSNGLLKKALSNIGSKAEKRLKSKLKPKTGKYEKVGAEKIKKNKSLLSKATRKPQGYKVREPKVNTVDRDALKEKTMESILKLFARYHR